MHIVRISISFPPRICGWSQHAFALSREQAAAGHAVTVLQPFPDAPTPSGAHVELVPSKALLARWGCLHGRVEFGIRAATQLRKLHQRQPIDVVHLHGDIHEIAPVRAVTRSLGVPLVLTCHSGLARGRAYRLLAPPILRSVDRAIGVSEAVVEDLRSVGIPADRLTAISSGIDTKRFAPADTTRRQAARRSLGLPSDAFLIACVARLDPVKGHADLLEAMRIGAGTCGELLLVGNGPLDAELRAAARDLPGVHFLGEQPAEHVRDVLAAADAAVLASVDLLGVREGTPTCVLEAMACGLPLVVTDVGNLRQLVAGTDEGILVPQRAPAALAAALQLLGKDATFRLRLGDANRARALDRDWQRVASRVTDWYSRDSA
jgi:glycosyltransferase involved in cell wall biosynthesis